MFAAYKCPNHILTHLHSVIYTYKHAHAHTYTYIHTYKYA